MNKNTFVLILVAVLIGVANGLYQFVYPFFLQDIGISFGSMGIIFSSASIAMAILGIILGWLSDLSGRKKYYSFSISLAFITTLVTPVMRRIWEMTIVKILRDTANSIRMALHPTLIYDYTKKGFTRLLARTQGLTSLMAAVGTFVSAYLLSSLGYTGSFFISGLVILGATTLFVVVYTEKKRETKRVTFSGLRSAFTWDIPRNLKFIAGSSFIFSLGNPISHGFIAPLFFSIKFGLDPITVATIMSLHRLSAGLPMILGASFIFQRQNLIEKHLKKLAMISLLYQGVMIAVTGFSPNLLLAVIGWLTHDIFGPPLRAPAQGTLIQRFSSDENRGRDTNVVNAFAKIASIISPLLAGFLATANVSLPMMASGLIVAAAPLFYLPLKDKMVVKEIVVTHPPITTKSS